MASVDVRSGRLGRRRGGNRSSVDPAANRARIAPVDRTGSDRPAHEESAIVKAVGKFSEAVEYIERARGHLYEFHQLVGHADFLLDDAVVLLGDAGMAEDGARIDRELVGRNVLFGRWTFQVIDEFDDGYYRALKEELRRLEATYCGGERHLHERSIKDRRRTPGLPGHERVPIEDEVTDR